MPQITIRGSTGGKPAEWSHNMPSRGLGDTIAKITAATGIASVAAVIFGGDCGCAKRQAALNAAVPFKDKSNG